jgi:YidC/Oxa1 family membrane protein insertase
MKKNLRKTLILITLLALLLFVFASCSSTIPEFDEYIKNGTDNLGGVAKLIMWMHGWIGNYGLTVIVFTVFLKLITLPFDIWQRFAMKKSQLKMQEMQPLIAAIDKRYGAESPKARQEKQKLQSQNMGSTLASCLPMILTMVLFFVMFGGLRDYSNYQNITNYNSLNNYYSTTQTTASSDELLEKVYDAAVTAGYTGDFDSYAKTVARVGIAAADGFDSATLTVAERETLSAKYLGIGNYYNQSIKESFLWMQSIWQPDTWAPIFPTYAEFNNTARLSSSAEQPEAMYNLIRNEILGTARRADGTWNGYMLLPIASVGLSFLSIFITQRLERKKSGDQPAADVNPQQAASNKMMMFLMPLMMAFFGFMYTGAFAVYMVTNYMLSILTTIALRAPINAWVAKSLKKAEEKNPTPKANYKR